MTRKVVVKSEFEFDVNVTEAWYCLRNKSAGVQFSQAVADALQVIRENPFQYQVVFGRYRHARLRRFP